MAPIPIIPISNDTLGGFVLLVPSALGSARLEILTHGASTLLPVDSISTPLN